MNCRFDLRRRIPSYASWIQDQAVVRIAIACVIASAIGMQAGCSTASSLGLPVASGPYQLLSTASKIRDTAGHPEHVPHEMSKVVQMPHRVEPGDVLVVEPADFDSPVRFPSDQTVQADGTIDLGQYGRVAAAGLTLDEIRQQAQVRVAEHHATGSDGVVQASYGSAPERARPAQDLNISVRIVSNESSVVYVLGEVNAPGTYPLVGRETVLDAIISAGGLTDRANEHKLILTRPAAEGEPRMILPICYQQIVQLGDTSTNYQVQPGDRIYIPSLTILEDIRQSLKTKEGSCPHCQEFEP